MLGLIVGLVIITGSLVGGVAFAHRGGGSPTPVTVVDNPLPAASASGGPDDSGRHGGDTPHATPGRSADDRDDTVCEDNAAQHADAAGDCRRGADHPED